MPRDCQRGRSVRSIVLSPLLSSVLPKGLSKGDLVSSSGLLHCVGNDLRPALKPSPSDLHENPTPP